MNWIRRIMNKLFIDNESFDIDEDDIKRRLKLIRL